MSHSIYVIDTNVVVSALITRSPEANVCRILDGMLRGQFPCLMSPALLAEYRQVLLRPKLKKLHGLFVEELDQILEELVLNAIWHEPVREANTSRVGHTERDLGQAGPIVDVDTGAELG